MSQSQEKAILALMAEITSITDLSTLLNVVVQKLPEVVEAIGCWIYLRPEYVPEYNGVLIRREKELSDGELLQIFDDFIVLAATNAESKKSLIGKAFFGTSEGITGWVYKNAKLLSITDVRDERELKSLSSNLHWANEYHEGDELYQPGEKRRLLVVPLVLEGVSIGALKFHATLNKEPFSEISQEIATIVSNIVAGSLRQTWMVAEQRQTISRLIETGNKNTPLDVITDVTESLKVMLNYSRSEFYLRDENGEEIYLLARNGTRVLDSDVVKFRRGQSLIGWVFKTGHPLIISDIKQFMSGCVLNEDLLWKLSDTQLINDDDKLLKCEENANFYSGTSRLLKISFLAVPVKNKNGEVLGVLCGYRTNPSRIGVSNERSHLMIADSFASTISVAIENNRQKMLGDLLIELGRHTDPAILFKFVTDRIPKIVVSSGCSIFVTKRSRDGIQLALRNTSRKNLSDSNNVLNVEYSLGEGKTGLSALTRSTLLINHYGVGIVSRQRLEKEYQRVRLEHPQDLVHLLKDEQNNEIGILQLRTRKFTSKVENSTFDDFTKTAVFQSEGVPSPVSDKYLNTKDNYTWSFIAVPIVDENKLMGVITLTRNMPSLPFSSDDTALIESVAGRLASVLSNLDLEEQRKLLFINLAHEINTPLTGVIVDSELLYNEAPANSDLQKLAKHNLEQVLRLHMQTSTTMSVLSGQELVRKFTAHSIYRPLKEACELFEAEANNKGCNIVGPRAQGGEFPRIEMSLLDLTTAFKNVIHNAVKYSFEPPENSSMFRTIKVWGEFDKTRKDHYNVYVQNYGDGILPHEIEKRLIFERYYRGEIASGRRTGSGFGLAYTRLIIEDLHHGFINVTSVQQENNAYLTTFAISLPIKQPT